VSAGLRGVQGGSNKERSDEAADPLASDVARKRHIDGDRKEQS
jgi:hypothetical protein